MATTEHLPMGPAPSGQTYREREREGEREGERDGCRHTQGVEAGVGTKAPDLV